MRRPSQQSESTRDLAAGRGAASAADEIERLLQVSFEEKKSKKRNCLPLSFQMSQQSSGTANRSMNDGKHFNRDSMHVWGTRRRWCRAE
jgi:hypothetical protein